MIATKGGKIQQVKVMLTVLAVEAGTVQGNAGLVGTSVTKKVPAAMTLWKPSGLE